MDIQTLNFGTTLIRNHVGPDPNECGSKDFWQSPLNGLFAQMRFPGLHAKLKLSATHMDHSSQDIMTANRQPCLQDYDPNTPGYQVAAGLYTGAGNLAIGLFPANWTPEYAGPLRPLTDAARSAARGVLSHEFGHFYADMSRYARNEDDISRLNTARFRELRPHQAAGDNEHEDLAETYRLICGADGDRGTFSDGKAFNPSPELRSTIRCLYWLACNLQGAWVCSLVPQAGGVMYQVWLGLGWKWRWVSADDWHSQEWDGQQWKKI